MSARLAFPILFAALLGVAQGAWAQPGEDLIVTLRDPLAAANMAEMQAAAGRLSERIGLPLLAVRATSGGELILGFDRTALAQDLKAAADGLQGVGVTELVPASDPARPPTLRITPAQSLQDMAGLGEISERLTERTGTPVDARVQDGTVVVQADADELAAVASRRLRELPEVSRAEPNLTVEIDPPDEMIMKPL